MGVEPNLWPVVAEPDRVQWDFEPLERVGPLRFGMVLPEATSAMDAQGFAAHANAISNFGPFEQVRAEFRKTESARTWQTDVVAYFVDSIGLTCVVVDARTGPQVTVEGIRLIGRTPSELSSEIAAHLEKISQGMRITTGGDITAQDWGMVPRAQRAGDVVLTRAVFGRPNAWAYTTDDCIPADEWKNLRDLG